MNRFNKFWIGLLSCLLFPALLFVCTWPKLSGMPLSDISHWIHFQVFLNFLIFCTLPDLLIMFLGYKTDSWNLCRGSVLGITPYLMLLFYLFF